MYRPTDRQTTLLESRFLLPPEKRERLERSWAHVFRTRILPTIDEEPFRSCFHEGDGRPNKSVRLLVGLHLLKEAEDLTDEQVLDALEFNLQWQYALAVEPGAAHTCQKTLHNFRCRLLENDRVKEVFERVTRAMAEADGVSFARQRLDSTHVLSNIAVLTRLGLFVETVTNFLKTLRRELPERLEELDAGYRKRYLEREGYFADAKRAQAQRRLPAVAADVLRLVRKFEADPEVRGLEAYRLMERLLGEQCVVVEGGGEEGEGPVERVEVREGREVSGGSLQSPYDPDATYGHKGKGYEVQVAETCVADNPYQVVTDVEVNGANESDQAAVVPVVERLDERGMKPEELVTDTGFGSGENIVACAQRGVELLAPVQDPDRVLRADPWTSPVEVVVVGADPGPADVTPMTHDGEAPGQGPAAPEVAVRGEVAEVPSEPESAGEPAAASMDPSPSGAPRLDLADFTYTSDFQRVTSCPAGEAPTQHETVKGGTRIDAYFGARACEGCPMASRCPARRVGGTQRRRLRYRPAEAATSQRQREQRTPGFLDRYRIRSGIESTNSVLKGVHGADDLRVRRRPRVRMALIVKVTALNVRRCIQHHLDALDRAADGAMEPCPA